VIAPEHPLHERVGSGLELLGWDGVDLALTPGGVLRFNTHWRVTTTTDATWVTFAHLRGVPRADGSVVYAQRDSEPCDESYPTPRWRVGERVIERTHIDLPLDLPAGEYALYPANMRSTSAGTIARRSRVSLFSIRQAIRSATRCYSRL